MAAVAAGPRPVGWAPSAERIGCCLKRSDVIGGPFAADVFALCDAIVLKDDRLAALWDERA